MRVSKSFLREVNDFGKSFTLRCVKIQFESGQDEILVTNLTKAEFSRKSISELYTLRWKIETSFLHLKYVVCMEDFMGIKQNSIN